jgi:CHAT domain-containing protein
MASKDLYPDAETPPEVEEYLQLQRQLDRLRHPPESGGMGELSRSPYHRDDTGKLQEQKIDKIHELEKRRKQLWQQIRKNDPVLAGQLQVDPLKIEDIQQLIENEQTAILNFYTTNEDTYIFVLRQNSTTLHTCQGQGIETLQLWMGQNWLIPYLGNREQWRDNIGSFLSELAQRLQLPQLIDQHLADIEELVIVPHLFLHQIPFAALPIANSIPTADSDSATDATRGMIFSRKRPPAKKPKPAPTPKPTYLSDKYRLRVIPSCQILSYCHENQKKKKIPPSPQMGIVENATNDLPFSGYECQAIAKTYSVPESLHLRGDRATPTNYRHLAQQVQLLHSSHHAEADLNDPLNSKLRLADGEVTLGEIFTWRLPNLLEVFLACCETNFTPQTTPADDILVIAAGWLSAGALNVVSTLWAVDDCATALFSILYYEQRHQQPTLKRSEALRRAQFQLRNLTGKEFNANYRAPLEAHLRKIGKNPDLERYCNLQHPFESPRYWAAFVSQGMN